MTILQKLTSSAKVGDSGRPSTPCLGNDSRTEEQDAELVKLTDEGQKIEPEIRAAIVAESRPGRKSSWRVTRKPASLHS